ARNALKRAVQEARTVDPPLGEAEHDTLARNTAGLESDATVAVLNPCAEDNIDPEKARKDIQSLVSGMKDIGTLLGTSRHAAEQALIAQFRETPYGKFAEKELRDKG
ncbi:unnamed protein product, partial [Ectocarpus sp. 12 AP-2014]